MFGSSNQSSNLNLEKCVRYLYWEGGSITMQCWLFGSIQATMAVVVDLGF
jgi:hypothetical protein